MAGTGFHVTRSACAAARACSSRSATTPMKSRITTVATTPGSASIDAVSTSSRLVPTNAPLSRPAYGGRTTWPWSMPGRRTSCTYAQVPAALSGMSTRCTDWPTTRYSATGLSGASAASSRRSRRPASSAANAMRAAAGLARWPMLPSATSNSSGARPSTWPARSSRNRRACAAAWRSGTAATWIVSLAIVGPWSGPASMSPSTIVTRASGTSSSSATIWASAVRMPVPRSTWPLKAVTPPSSASTSSNSGASAPGSERSTISVPSRSRYWPRGGGACGRSLTPAPAPRPRAARRAAARRAAARRASRHGVFRGACRSGTGCSAGPRGPAPRSAAAGGRAAPWRR